MATAEVGRAVTARAATSRVTVAMEVGLEAVVLVGMTAAAVRRGWTQRWTRRRR